MAKINDETFFFFQEGGEKRYMMLFIENITTFMVWSLFCVFHLANAIFWRKVLKIYLDFVADR